MVQHVESLLTKVSSAAHARLLAEDLIESVADLNNLAAALVRRSRRRTPTQPETGQE